MVNDLDVLDVDGDTFIDTDGEYGDPGTEYVFHPGQEQGDNNSSTDSADDNHADAGREDNRSEDETQYLMKDGDLV
jgi:hypothetical protein